MWDRCVHNSQTSSASEHTNRRERERETVRWHLCDIHNDKYVHGTQYTHGLHTAGSTSTYSLPSLSIVLVLWSLSLLQPCKYTHTHTHTHTPQTRWDHKSMYLMNQHKHYRGGSRILGRGEHKYRKIMCAQSARAKFSPMSPNRQATPPN